MRVVKLSVDDLSFDPQTPYAALADWIRERGLGNGTIVAFSVRDAGNLRAFLPKAEVLWHNSAERTVEHRIVPERSICAAIGVHSKARTAKAGTEDGAAVVHRSLAGKEWESIEGSLAGIVAMGKTQRPVDTGPARAGRPSLP